MKKIFTRIAIAGVGLSMAIAGAIGLSHNTKMASADTSRTVYCAIDPSTLSTYTLKVNANIGDNNTWRQSTMEEVADTTSYPGKKIFKGTFEEKYGGVDVLQFQLYDGETWHGQDEVISGWKTSDNFDKKLHVYGASANTWAAYTEPEPEPAHTYSYSINGGELVNLVEHEGNEVKTAEKVTMAVGDTITFKKDGEAFAVTPKDDGSLTKVYSDGGVLTAAAAIDEVLYLNTSTAKLWAGQFPEGYFLLGVGDNWNAKLGLAAEKESEGDAYFVKNFALAANAEIKMIKTPASGTEVTYYDADAEKVATSSGVAFEVTGEYHNLKVTNAGTYDVYYNPTSGWYSIEQEVTYTVKIGTADPIAISLKSGTEYQTAEVALAHGQAVSVYANGVADGSFHIKEVGNNNYLDGGIIADVTDRVYIDLSAKTIFVGGFAHGGYHMLVEDSVTAPTYVNYHGMTQNLEPLDPSFREFYSTSISFTANQYIRFVDTTAEEGEGAKPVIFEITNINSDSVAGFTKETISAKDYLKATKAVSASVYLKLKDKADEVYFGTVEEYKQAAYNFAALFNSEILGVCNANPKPSDITDKYKQAVKDTWLELAAEFNSLKLQASKDELKNATASYAQEDMREFAAKYDSIFSLRGAEYELTNFAGRSVSAGSTVVNVTVDNDSNNIVAIFAVIIGLSIFTVSALYIARKKKMSK